LAVKIVRQPKKIALIGAPTSAAALRAGHERAPAALRAAGLVERLQHLGYEVTDLGDGPVHVFQPDDEHPRARNVGAVVAALEELRPRVEQAVKSGALPLVLGGDCVIALATVAGVRRYYRNVSLVYLDRDADLNVPATTPSGCVDGMVISHVIGRGAPELVRFFSEPPLVREPDVALFGFERLDPPELEFLARSPVRRYSAADVQRQGAVAAAEAALERVHVSSRELVLHLDVDVISAEDFSATNFAASGGLRLEEVRQALSVFARQKNLVAMEVTVYNPELDPDGSAARVLVELLASAFAARLEALAAPEAAPSGLAAAATAQEAAGVVSAMTEPTEATLPAAPVAEGEPTAESSGAAPGVPPSSEAAASEASLQPSGSSDPATEDSGPDKEPPRSESSDS
jgi:arginase